MPDKQIRVGLVGMGLRSNLAKHVHKPDEGVSLVHVCDVDPATEAKAKELFGDEVRFSTDFQVLADDDSLDAVMLLSPDWLHAEHAVPLLEAGRPVFLEKPMAITLEDCDRILAAAERTGTKLYVGHNMRHFPFVLKMKELIDGGAIGQVQTAWERHFISYGGDAYFKDWHADRRYSTGLLLQKGAHDLDLMHWLCGGFTKRVHAMGRLSVYNRCTDISDENEPWENRWSDDNWPPLKARQLNPIIDVEDVSMLHAELDNGVLVSYQQCHYTPDEMRNFTFIGDAGRIESTKNEAGHWVIKLWNQRSDKHKANGDEHFELKPAKGGHDGADPLMIKEFVAYLRDEAEPRCHPIDARMAVAVGYQATMSIRQGGVPLDVPPVGEAVATTGV